MAYRIPRARGQSLRDYPTYSLPEAAVILAMSRRTLQSWVYDRPYFDVSGAEQTQRLLSFNDLAQFYFLRFIRKHAKVGDRQARELLTYTQEVTDSEYPLLHEDISVLRRHVFLTRGKVVLDLLNPRGQFVFQEIVGIFASRFDRDSRGLMSRIYPWRLWKEGDSRRPVSIDPHIMSGRLVVTGTRIPALVLATRARSGESIREIAKDYEISQHRVTESLRHFDIGLRKAA
jgi:uncharacterized protein (DUF433 family)